VLPKPQVKKIDFRGQTLWNEIDEILRNKGINIFKKRFKQKYLEKD